MTTEARQLTNHRRYMHLKAQTFKHYTPVEESGRWVPKCAICGEEDLDILVLHHTEGSWKEDRARYGYGRTYFESLRARQFPPGYQVLCANCHLKAHKKFPTP